jgi:putative DNA primase/helicase
LNAPRVVNEATLEYRREESVLTRFLADTCVLTARATVAKKLLYDGYAAWCDKQGLIPLSQPRLSKALKERNIAEERGTGGMHCWRGLGLCVVT